MNLQKLSIVGLFAMGTFAVAPVSAYATPVPQSTAAKPSDKTLDERVESKIRADASLKKFDIDVDVNLGVARLTGKVATEAQKVRAGHDAQVAGLASVDNQIVVDKDAGKGVTTKTKEATEKAGTATKDAAEKTGSATKEAAEKTGSATKEAAEKTGSATKEAVSKTGEVINDAWITTKVKTSFVGEDALKGSDINVDTDNHVVTLHGTVKTAAGRDRALEIAKTTEGVNRVVNKLTIAR
jgi:osmotically-inducible protein OsmY